jgi:hypothetical protein
MTECSSLRTLLLTSKHGLLFDEHCHSSSSGVPAPLLACNKTRKSNRHGLAYTPPNGYSNGHFPPPPQQVGIMLHHKNWRPLTQR